MSSAHSKIGRIFYSLLSFCRTYPQHFFTFIHWKRPHADLIKGEVWLISGRAVTFISRLSFSLSAGASGLHTHTHTHTMQRAAQQRVCVLSTLARRALRMTWGAPPIKTLLLSAPRALQSVYAVCMYLRVQHHQVLLSGLHAYRSSIKGEADKPSVRPGSSIPSATPPWRGKARTHPPWSCIPRRACQERQKNAHAGIFIHMWRCVSSDRQRHPFTFLGRDVHSNFFSYSFCSQLLRFGGVKINKEGLARMLMI